MNSSGKVNVLKKDEMYKELRYILKYMLGKPNYADIIKDGVSLKWYYWDFCKYTDERFRDKLKENIINNIPKFLLEYFDIKIKLLYLNKDPDDSVLYRNRIRGNSMNNSLRILIKRKIFNE